MNEMKSNRYTLLLVLFVGLFLTSCYDKDNTIHRLPDLQITNISVGSVKTGDELNLHPIGMLGGEEVECTYQWYRYHGNEPELIYEGQDLVWRVDTTDFVNIGLDVTHVETGIMISEVYNFKITPRIERGWIVLKENAEGNTDMDAFLMTGNDVMELAENLLAEPLEGKPVALLEAGKYYWYHPITLVREERLECLLPVSEKSIGWYRIKDEVMMLSGDDMFYEPSPVATRKFEASGAFGSTIAIALVDNGRVSRTLASYSGSRFMPEIVGNYKLAPWLITGVSMNLLVGYDELTSSFVMVGDDALSYFPNTYREGDDVQISSNGMDADLLFFGQTHGNLDPNYSSYPAYGPGIGYALMRKKGNTEQVELYGLNFREATSYGTIYSPIRFHRTIEVSACPEFASADFYTLHQDKKILYFVKDNVLHYYDIENDRFVKDCHVFDGEVTFLKFVGNNYDLSDSWDAIQYNYTFNRLMAATCSGEDYSVYTFEENDNGNLVLRPERTLEGRGKVKKMLWYGYNPTGFLSKLPSNIYIYN